MLNNSNLYIRLQRGAVSKYVSSLVQLSTIYQKHQVFSLVFFSLFMYIFPQILCSRFFKFKLMVRCLARVTFNAALKVERVTFDVLTLANAIACIE